MKNGIFYLTYNGYYNYTTGIGTQTKILLAGIDRHYEYFKKHYGDFEVNIVVPEFDETVDDFDSDHKEYADKIISKYGGKVYTCKSAMEKAVDGFWTIENWKKLTPSAASIVYSRSQQYNKTMVLAVDPPYLNVPRHIELLKKDKNNDIKSVILDYSSSFIHGKKVVSFESLAWEYQGLVSARIYNDVYIGDVCNFMTNHFVEYYGADKNSFVKYPSSLLLEDPSFRKLSNREINELLDKYRIPKDKKIIFSFGRASWIKGFDTLVESLAFLEKDIHLVLIAVPFEADPKEYEEIIKRSGQSYTLITKFTRDLPPALCQYKNCKVVVCPSRREPFSNIPLEVSIWAKDSGPIILASDIDGFLEQIKDGQNGFLFKVANPRNLANKIDSILEMTEKKLNYIREAAYKKVIKERVFKTNFDLLLNSLWGDK